MNIELPSTEEGLENWMKENCYNFNNYSINGNIIFEGFGIEKFGNLFLWYYVERGTREPYNTFSPKQKLWNMPFIKSRMTNGRELIV